MEDTQIVALYFDRDEAAIEQTEAKYGRYLHAIAGRILRDDGETEETVSDTYLKTWNTVPPNRPASLKAYVGMLCRQLALHRWEKNRAQKRGGELAGAQAELTEQIAGESGEQFVEDLALSEALSRFLRTLPPDARTLFVRRYWYFCPISELARMSGEKESTIAMRLLRTRKKLAQFLEKEGFSL